MEDNSDKPVELDKPRTDIFLVISLDQPSLWFVHAMAISVQVIFGIGNCIGKEALNSMPAIIFAFYRELFAGLILLAVCVCSLFVFDLVYYSSAICP